MNQKLPEGFTSKHAAPPEIMTGMEWVVDASGCDPMKLKSLSVVRSVCDRIIDELQLKVVGEHQSHQFPAPGGITVLYLLSESHLAAHTYPEHQIATFNLYCCRRRSDWPWQDQLSISLDARQVNVRCFGRGSIETACIQGSSDTESMR